MAEESLTLLASVQEDFKDPLDDLRNSLVEVGLIADEVFPIDIDARGASSTLTELKAIEKQVDAIDDDINIGAKENDIFAGGVDLTDEEAMGVADMFNPKSAFRQTPGMGADGGGTATADGGGSSFLDTSDIRLLRNQFDDAFDESTLIGRGGEITHGGQLLEGGLVENVDGDALANSILDDDSGIGLDVLRRFESDDVMDVSDAFTDLADADLLDRKRGGLVARMQRMTPTMTDFYNALAAILPLLIVYIGALPAVIGALGGLAAAAIGAAGALAALGGLAVMGLGMEDGEFSMENLTDVLSDLRDSFVESFEPLASKLTPLAEEAISGLDRLFDRLAIAGDALLRLRDDARALGGYLIDVLPAITSDFATLGDVASPIFGDIGEFLDEADLIDAFARALGQALPMLSQLTNEIIIMIPLLYELSLGFLTVAAYVTSFISIFFQAIDMLPGGIYLIGVLVAGLLAVYTSAILAGKASGLLTKVWTYLGGAASTVTTAIATLRANVQSYGVTAGLATFATNNLSLAISTLWNVITLGAAGFAMVSMIDQMNSLSESTKDVTDELKNFRNVSNNLNGPSMSASSGGGGGGTYTSFTDNRQFNINANNQEDADRAAQSLSYSTNYSQGKNLDSQFSTS